MKQIKTSCYTINIDLLDDIYNLLSGISYHQDEIQQYFDYFDDETLTILLFMINEIYLNFSMDIDSVYVEFKNKRKDDEEC